ncbi:MAG: 23S rRNA (uracil(1939)-C(5))-methyltransferase RlmD [Candidatus Gastranaerophilales bacterium]|nr:23S rRNA (uracil(1939)-C(5))-methyltransferase RlmD [Candidatus Gastranaerophilales bacterium]
MIKLGDIIEVIIEKSVYGGDGLARIGKENFVVFVKDSIPNDKLKVKITSLNKKFARAEIVEIIDSKNRIKPFCALYNACGSCDCQIASYDFLIKQKSAILKDIFKNILSEDKILSIIPSPDDKFYRHKVQYPAQQTKNSKRILLGYYKKNSHDLTNIKYCPVQPEIINEITQFIRENFELNCYDEKNHKGLLKNVLLRISNATNDILLTLVLNCHENDFINYESAIFRFFKKITAQFPSIVGGFVNFNPKKSNKILGKDTLKVVGENFIIEKLGDKSYKIGATSFFQVNPKSAVNLFNIVKENIKPNSTILDAYGGVGAIGIYVSEKASKITLVEENENAISMAYDNFQINNIENYEILEGDAKKHFLNFEKEKRQFDYVILDPPRSGCNADGLKAIAKLAKNIIYVSCNPQTLRRDMSLLIEEGFKPKCVQGVDLFPYTHHIEVVGILNKN